MTDQPLTPAAREALEKVVGPDARGTYRLAEEVWLAASDYYQERHIQQQGRVVEALSDCDRARKALRDALKREEMQTVAWERYERLVTTWVRVPGDDPAANFRAALAAEAEENP